MMGLSVYWDLTEVAAKAEYTWDWEATELPMELFFRQGMSEEHVQSARAKWFNSVCGLALRTRAAGACVACHVSLPLTLVHAGQLPCQPSCRC